MRSGHPTLSNLILLCLAPRLSLTHPIMVVARALLTQP